MQNQCISALCFSSLKKQNFNLVQARENSLTEMVFIVCGEPVDGLVAYGFVLCGWWVGLGWVSFHQALVESNILFFSFDKYVLFVVQKWIVLCRIIGLAQSKILGDNIRFMNHDGKGAPLRNQFHFYLLRLVLEVICSCLLRLICKTNHGI